MQNILKQDYGFLGSGYGVSLTSIAKELAKFTDQYGGVERNHREEYRQDLQKAFASKNPEQINGLFEGKRADQDFKLALNDYAENNKNMLADAAKIGVAFKVIRSILNNVTEVNMPKMEGAMREDIGKILDIHRNVDIESPRASNVSAQKLKQWKNNDDFSDATTNESPASTPPTSPNNDGLRKRYVRGK